MPLAALFKEVEDKTPDQLAGRSDELVRDLDKIGKQIRDAADLAGASRTSFQALDHGASASEAAADAEMARSEMDVQAEAYRQKRTETLLLRWAIERKRKQTQNPLQSLRTEWFERLERLGLEIDDPAVAAALLSDEWWRNDGYWIIQPLGAIRLPILFQSMPQGGRRFWEFFTVNIRNPNTRRAYFKAVERFAAWCEDRGLGDLAGVTPIHVAAYVEQLGRTHSKPTVKQHLAAIRMLFDWLCSWRAQGVCPVFRAALVVTLHSNPGLASL